MNDFLLTYFVIPWRLWSLKFSIISLIVGPILKFAIVHLIHLMFIKFFHQWLNLYDPMLIGEILRLLVSLFFINLSLDLWVFIIKDTVLLRQSIDFVSK